MAAVRAAVTRRANRRIIMRQIGDRLIPVGVTSGRVHPITPEEAAQGDGNDNGGSRRSRRQRNQNQDLNQFLMGLGGQDLEDLMVMEAMRLSLVEHEEQQRREAANRDQSSSSNPDATPVSGNTALPTSLPPPFPQSTSIPEPESGSHTPIPSTTSLVPTHSFIEPSNSSLSMEGASMSHRPLTPVNYSRKRTPSPTNIPSIDSLQPPSQSSSWQRQSSNPRPFSTIAAAMSAASTATAILKGDEVYTRGDGTHGVSGSISTTVPSSIPAPVVSSSSLPTTSILSSDSHSFVNVTGKPDRPPMSVETEYASSIFSREPLLGGRPETPIASEAGLQGGMSLRAGEGAVE